MNKRLIIFLILLGSLLILLSYVSYAQASPGNSSGSGRPNIVWITCEDMSPHLGAFGDSLVKTPNLDALAAEGVRYTRVYTVAGVCAPSRNGIITGMYPQSIGGNNMRNYQAGRRGQEQVTSRVLPSYSIVPPPYVRCFTEYLRERGYYCTNNPKEDYQFEAPVTAWDESGNMGHWRNRPSGSPFFAVFNLGVTHESQIWLRDHLPLEVDTAKLNLPPYYPDIPEARRALARQLSNVMEMDRQAGRIIQELKDSGLFRNTIIFFFSDHGDGLPFVKREITTRGLHIPLIIKLPEGRKAGTIDESLISSIDLGPTVLSLAGVELPGYVHGRAFLGSRKSPSREYVFAARDRMDERVDRVRTVFDGRYQYIRNYMPELPYYQDLSYRLQIPLMKKMLEMKDEGKLDSLQMRWFQAKPEEELYDTRTDPFQLHNLADAPQYQQRLAHLRKVFLEWMQSTGDLHVVPERDLVKKMWNGNDTAPITAAPVLKKTPNGFFLSCDTEGASIGFQLIHPGEAQSTRKRWMLYDGGPLPIRTGDTIVVRAQRIGFQMTEAAWTFAEGGPRKI